MRSKTYSLEHAISRSPLVRLFSGAGQLEVLVMVLGVAVGLLAGMLLDSFILGFLALAAVAGLGWLLLSLFGPDTPHHNHRSTKESREGQQQVPSLESSVRR